LSGRGEKHETVQPPRIVMGRTGRFAFLHFLCGFRQICSKLLKPSHARKGDLRGITVASRNGETIMKSFARKVQRFLASQDGPTAVEYAVMLALIVVVCLMAISAVGTKASTTFTNVADTIGSAGGS
jgi:pilus assembly protein Flp/PilA